MSPLLFHVIILLGLLRSCSSYRPENITIQVSDNGLDDPSCIQNGESCKTLTYVLDSLSSIMHQQGFAVTINITCNQTIREYSNYAYDFQSVRIVGHNKACIILNSSINISYGGTHNGSYFGWIGLGFVSNTNHTNLFIIHSHFDTLVVLNCRIMTAGWKFLNAKNVSIKNSEFGQVHLCPTVHISRTNGLVNFFNNSITNCYANLNITIFYLAVMRSSPDKSSYLNLNIVDCTFAGLKGIKGDSGFTTTESQKDPKLFSVDTEGNFLFSINKCEFVHNYQLTILIVNVHKAGKYSMNVQLNVLKTIIRNNTATSVLVEFIGLNSEVFYKMAVALKKIVVYNNLIVSAYELPIRDIRSTILHLAVVHQIQIEDSSFSNNKGTALAVTPKQNKNKTCLSIRGEINFTNNTGVLGGACNLDDVHVMIKTNSTVFEGNSAVYGGALYLNNTALSETKCNNKVRFINNTATTSGNSMYYATITQDALPKCSFSDVPLEDIGSPAFNMQYKGDSTISLIPGQNIYINVSVTDYYGSPSSCTADVYLICDNQWLFVCLNKHIRLNGPDHVVLAQEEVGNYTEVDTKLSISAPRVLDNTTVEILFMCRNNLKTRLNINLTISACPLGFVYNNSEGVCKCANVATNHGTVICSANLGITCITRGYWYGPFTTNNTTMSVSAQCSYPDCSYSYKPCPAKMISLGFSGDFNLLGNDPDEQCSIGRGGLLCKSCAQGYQYTFLSVSCVASSTCEWWQPYLVLVITLMFQLMIAMALMIVVRFKIAAGSGFLYGPMLFLAIISHLPLDTDPNLFILRTFILVITAVPLLNLEPFGLIPWCFFHPFTKIYNYSLQYLGPITVLLVIGFATLKARWCPRTLLKWQNSRLRVLCILMLLSFWSLADITMNITFNILTSTRLIHNNDVVVSVEALEPNLKYLSLKHIPIVILAFLVLLIVIIPLLVVLLVSPALSRIINLTRIKPFLDEFQSCYRDSCRWYSTVYFIVWIGFVSMQSQAVPMIYIQTLFMILLSAHCLIRPYQSMVLNIIDTLILVDVNFLLSLMQSNTNQTKIWLIHILVLVPILSICVWFIGVSLVKSHNLCRYLLLKSRQQPIATTRDQQYQERLPSPPIVPVQEVRLYETNEEGEPLI